MKKTILFLAAFLLSAGSLAAQASAEGVRNVIYLIGESYQWRGNDVPVFLWITAGVGILIMAGSLLTAFSKLRCPYCGASLMAGGRMPSSLPHFCPDCGKTLDDCD